jgi:tetratricopeptide (TPR) repeat protein
MRRTAPSGLTPVPGSAPPATYGMMSGMKTRLFVLTVTISAAALPGAAVQSQTTESEIVQQARKLESSSPKEALALYRQAVQKNPKEAEAHLGIGRLLDIDGDYAAARRHIQQAIDGGARETSFDALSTMAVSYAFEGNAAEAAKYYQKVFDSVMQSGAADMAANTANALGRVYLETGDFANAEKWYRTGYEAAGKMPNRTPEQIDLAEMRWHHAQGRIAARRKQFDVARTHVDEVGTIVDRGRLGANQRLNHPHLAGYVAFYQGNDDEAIAQLAKADQNDPFILILQAKAYVRKKDQAQARALASKILAGSSHSLQMAFARPAAREIAQGK